MATPAGGEEANARGLSIDNSSSCRRTRLQQTAAYGASKENCCSAENLPHGLWIET